MATLREYVDGSGFYIKHSFAAGGRLHHVTYQVTDEAAALLAQEKLSDGAEISLPLFRRLLEKKAIFTASTGVTGIRLDKTKNGEERESPPGARPGIWEWVCIRLLSHPAVSAKLVDADNGEKEIQFRNIPDDFGAQLLEFAGRAGGADFIRHLDLSYANTTSCAAVTQPQSLGDTGAEKFNSGQRRRIKRFRELLSPESANYTDEQILRMSEAYTANYQKNNALSEPDENAIQ